MTGPATVASAVRDALCRDEVAEQLFRAKTYASFALQMLEFGDETAADYAIRRMVVHAEAAITTRVHMMPPAAPEAA